MWHRPYLANVQKPRYAARLQTAGPKSTSFQESGRAPLAFPGKHETAPHAGRPSTGPGIWRAKACVEPLGAIRSITRRPPPRIFPAIIRLGTVCRRGFLLRRRTNPPDAEIPNGGRLLPTYRSSSGNSSGSSPGSDSTGMPCSSLSHRPRSTKRQRSEQNGMAGVRSLSNFRRQMGHTSMAMVIHPEEH